ncbi:MAG: hypothetical protein P4K94_01025 [Terracidiphilus sp.]|nr:hypothetical protein [Terracidiphilus sp.]
MAKSSTQELETRAAEALEAMLEQVSAIKLKSIEHESPAPDRAIDMRAHVDVYGHSHTLICKVKADTQHGQVRTALQELRIHVSQLSGDSTPLLIAPYLSPEEQALCRECGVGFLDLEGNVRLVLDQTFIVRHSRPCRTPRPSQARAQDAESSVLRGFPPPHPAGLPTKARTSAFRIAS